MSTSRSSAVSRGSWRRHLRAPRSYAGEHSSAPGEVERPAGSLFAGKSTTMRLILGLDAPTSGSVTVDGLPYAAHPMPMRVVGALLEARAVHTSRSAYNHLKALAATHSISDRRVAEVIDMVGLHEVARKRAGGFSLGMGQRLGIASALLADPLTLILDEPVNDLHWLQQHSSSPDGMPDSQVAAAPAAG